MRKLRFKHFLLDPNNVVWHPLSRSCHLLPDCLSLLDFVLLIQSKAVYVAGSLNHTAFSLQMMVEQSEEFSKEKAAAGSAGDRSHLSSIAIQI